MWLTTYVALCFYRYIYFNGSEGFGVSNLPGLFLVHFLFGTDGHGSQEPRVKMVRGYGFHIIAVGTWAVPEKLGLLQSGLRSLVESAVWLQSGLRDSRLSLRVGSSPVCTQNVSSRTAASPMPSRLGMHSPLRTNSSTLFYIYRLPSSCLLCGLHILEALTAS